jgi:hypothetical protein
LKNFQISAEEKVENVEFISYNVFPIGYDEGMIKVVPGITLKEVLDKHVCVKSYLENLNTSEDINIFQKNYFKSCGMYYVQFINFF